MALILQRMTYQKILLLLAAVTIYSCGSVVKFTDGKTAYEMKQYHEAIPFFKEDYKKTKVTRDKGNLAFLLGESYWRMADFSNASEWFKIAYESQINGAALRYAQALKANEQYEDAIVVFKDAGSEAGNVTIYQNDIQSCKAAIQWKKDELAKRVKLTPLPLNTKYFEFSPTLVGDSLFFTTDRPKIDKKAEKYGWTGFGYSDIAKADKKGEDVSSYNALNTTYNDGSATFSRDGNEVVFVRCGSKDKNLKIEYCKLMHSIRENGVWQEPSIIFEGEFNYGSPLIAFEDRGLFFSSNMPDGFGGFDLYFCFKIPEGWSTPKNLGRGINTEGDEKFPFVDGDTLYFSSDGHLGMGGLDVFKAIKINGQWKNAQNMKSPINSGADDHGFIITPAPANQPDILKTGILASNRNGGEGFDDIYAFEIRKPVPKIDTTPVVVIEYQILLKGLTREKVFATPNEPSSAVTGHNPLGAIVVTVEADDSTFTVISDKSGKFNLKLREELDYKFTAVKDGYFKSSGSVTTKGLFKDPANPIQTLEVILTLDKIFKQKEIVLENIYYDYDRWEIRQDAQPTLNALAQILRDNPSIRIELTSHTDCRGNDSYNLTLSQKRAESAVKYLVERGISADRLQAGGYGETSPIEECDCRRCSEDQHQRNRRTAFKVID